MKKLPLQHPLFCQLEADFREWLMVLGYAQNSIYNLPHHVREFLYFLEQQAIWHIKDIRASHVEAFFRELKRRKNQRRQQPSAPKLSAAYFNKYLQALKLLSKYIRQTRQERLINISIR